MKSEEMDFLDVFGQLDDPRIDRKKLHPMPEILLLTLCAVICGAESWDDIETFGEAKVEFLRKYLLYEHGIPSDDTLRRFFRAIDPKQFQRLFIEWIRTWLNPEVADKIVAIDGKTLRGSRDGEQLPIHLVSAFASEAGIVLGQIKTQEKSNEITAIPELLEWLDVRSAIVTIDAMGCQNAKPEMVKAMVNRALNAGIIADYLLADAWFGTKAMIRLTQEMALVLVPVLRMKKNKMKYRISKFVRGKTVSRELDVQALYQHCVRRAWEPIHRQKYQAKTVDAELNLAEAKDPRAMG